MIYHEFQDLKLSALGFGTMRLPTLENGSIDVPQTEEMVKYALEHGVNYFDTAYPYHGGLSETVVGAALKNYPRESFYLADKFPGHQIAKSYHPEEVFEEQLEKCQVEYFDFYLLHNVNENSIGVYMDPQWGILDYFLEQKRLGRIRHLGFSTHGEVENIREFLDWCGDKMEFCQIQLNYLDWTLQNAKGKCDLLRERNIPIWVMEPIRGGALAALEPEAEASLRALRSDENPAAWALRWMQTVPQPTMVLSGMSSMAQMVENIATYESERPLNEAELAAVAGVAEGMLGAVPCTACRYCCDGCPMGLDIPMLLNTYNNLRISKSIIMAARIEGLPEEKRPSACIGCGACEAICPQKIEIPRLLAELHDTWKAMPNWREMCRQREEAAEKKRAAKGK